MRIIESFNSWKRSNRLLNENVQAILKKHEQGCQIVFVTARPHSARHLTKKMLKSLGFDKFTLLMGLQNSKRVLINDFNFANPFPRAEAINIERDSNCLKHYLK